MPDVLYVGLQDADKILTFGIDAGSGKLVVERFREPKHRKLGGAVRGKPGDTKARGEGCNVYDVPGSSCKHRIKESLRAVDHAVIVCGSHGFNFFDAQVLDALKDGKSSVVHNYVHVAKAV